MKRLVITRLLLPVAIISVAAAVPARAQNLLTNGSFETQNPQLATTGKVNGFATLTGWASTGGTPADSGIQGNANNSGSAIQKAEDGSFFVYEEGSDPGIFQITGTKLVAGETLTLSWYSLNSYQAPIQDVTLLAAATQTSTFAAATTIASANGSTMTAYALGAVPTAAPFYTEYTLTATVPAGDAGDYVGISTSNTAAAGNYLQTDNYTLAVVPEPRTYAMVIVGALTLLGAAYRRKQTLGHSVNA